MGDRLQYEEFGNRKLWFLYDADGTPVGFRYNNGTTTAYYYYVCNWRGDVVAIYSNSGLLCTYDYDAWGKVVSVKNASGEEVTRVVCQSMTVDNPLKIHIQQNNRQSR